jgi:hypothetical protein
VSLSPSEVDRALAGHPGWRRVGKTLIRDLSMRDFDGEVERAIASSAA